MNDVSDDNLREMHKAYFSQLGTCAKFKKIFSKATEGHKVLILDRTQQPPRVCFYKANVTPCKFKIGRSILFAMAQMVADRDRRAREELEKKKEQVASLETEELVIHVD